VGSYWAQVDEVAKYNVQLNYFEQLWMAWYTWMQNDVLATGIMSFVMHETVYFGRSLPWIIIDCIPYFNKYKIQAVSRHLRPRDLSDETDADPKTA
jgi:methylsterol monooxygenase